MRISSTTQSAQSTTPTQPGLLPTPSAVPKHNPAKPPADPPQAHSLRPLPGRPTPHLPRPDRLTFQMIRHRSPRPTPPPRCSQKPSLLNLPSYLSPKGKHLSARNPYVTPPTNSFAGAASPPLLETSPLSSSPSRPSATQAPQGNQLASTNTAPSHRRPISNRPRRNRPSYSSRP